MSSADWILLLWLFVNEWYYVRNEPSCAHADRLAFHVFMLIISVVFSDFIKNDGNTIMFSLFPQARTIEPARFKSF